MRDLRARIFDELRLVQDHRAEGKLVKFLQVAPEQRVVGDDDVVLRDLLAQIVPRRAAFEHEHLHARSEPLGFAPPVVQHGRRADDERRLGILGVAFLEPREPGQSLERFAEAHVIGENAAELYLHQMDEEIEAVLLIRPEFRLQTFRQVGGGNAFEITDAVAQGLRFRRFREALQTGLVQMRDMFQADFLRHGDEPVHAHVRHRLVRALHGIRIEFHPAGVRQFYKTAGRGGQPFEVGF